MWSRSRSAVLTQAGRGLCKRDEGRAARSLHSNPDAVLADFFDRVNVDEEGQLIVDGVRLELDGAKRRVAKRFGR